jgi:uridine phosphorylase
MSFCDRVRPTTGPKLFTMTELLYHLGFGTDELSQASAGAETPTLVLLSGDPNRSAHIAHNRLTDAVVLSENRGLNSYLATLPNGKRVICATSGMGGPSASIVLNELAQLGMRTIIRIGTTGSIQPHVLAGSVIVSSGALRRHGAALDIAPVEFPAVADPFLTVELSNAATAAGITHHVGITASVDTFFEGQERSASSANPILLRKHVGMTEEYRALGILNYEMEAATVFTASSVYGMAAGCVCAVIAQRTDGENVVFARKDGAIEDAITVAINASVAWTNR